MVRRVDLELGVLLLPKTFTCYGEIRSVGCDEIEVVVFIRSAVGTGCRGNTVSTLN
jgi:hypothetical protein